MCGLICLSLFSFFLPIIAVHLSARGGGPKERKRGKGEQEIDTKNERVRDLVFV